MKRLYRCVEEQKVNHSHAREAIYRILIEAEDACLGIEFIKARLAETYPRPVSVNTIYRHLNLFVSCGLAVTIQDDHKRAYYALTQEKPQAFVVCSRCHAVRKISLGDDAILSKLGKKDFIVLHTKCAGCLQV